MHVSSQKIKQDILSHIDKNFSDVSFFNEVFKKHPHYGKLELKNFLPEYITEELSKELDNIPLSSCKKFTRNKSCMYEHNNLTDTPIADAVVHAFNSSTFLNWLQNITHTTRLIPDPHLIGAGYMKSFKGDSLKVHTDFNWVEELHLYKKVNCIIYLNKDWQVDWNGSLKFYDTNNEKVISETFPDFGNLLIWEYDELAYHGYPESLNCPVTQSRKGLRLFYYQSNSIPSPDRKPHRSLYGFDKIKKTPHDIGNLKK